MFLAFANAPDEHLASLKTESRRVYRTLRPLEDDGQIHVHREESSELGELYEDLLRHDGRIVIFHYAGHADGATLRLEGGEGGGKGLASMLGQQSGLKLVFLNGCATKGHVRRLLDAGVPAVIATSVKIGDAKALEFSDAFYLALAEGRSISESFDSAGAFIEGRHGARGDAGVAFTRGGTDWEDDDEDGYDEPVLEWGLHVREDAAADLEQWRLPSAQSDWEVRLSDADGPLRNLDGSALVLKYQAPSRTVDALACANCGTSVTVTAGNDNHCAVCGSSDVHATSVTSQVADQYLPFRVSEADAHARATEFAGRDATAIESRKVYLPYWIIDAGIRSTFNAERGVVRDFDAESPKPEWEPVTDTVDLALDSHMVRAAVAPTGRDTGDRDWYWELDDAQALEPGNTVATPSVPLTESLQSAFEETSAQLGDELDAEIVDRVGGHDRRNISKDTRYRDLAARTVLLPHWYATVESDQGTAGLVINGQTAAVRSLQLPGTVNLTHRGENNMNKRTYEGDAKGISTSLAASLFAGIGIGLMVGLLLGMSAPSARSVVGIFIGAVGVALAALLGLNDKHFSSAKGLRIGSFGLAVFLAAPAGIYARDHGLFSPSFKERVEEITALEFSKEQALNYLAAIQAPAKKSQGAAGTEDASSANTLMALAISGGSYLFSGDGEIEACDALERGRPYDSESTFEEVRNSYSTMGTGWTKLATMASTTLQGDDRQKALFIARDAVCGFGFEAELDLKAADCVHFKTEATSGSISSPDLRMLFERVNKELSPDGRVNGLGLLERALCTME